ncbi:MAG: type II toxin-antitoxin system HicB family antitoxin [Acidobacteriota bacterium]|nr:type II toxin-antitoxin system HicB family antitoxin [Acidobacteriota bacterium]
MTKTFLVVFEKGKECWGAFAPDVPGTGGMGDTVEEARRSLLEGIGYILEHARETGQPLPEPVSTTVDFSEFDPNPAESHYEIEWLAVDVSEPSSNPTATTHQAA